MVMDVVMSLAVAVGEMVNGRGGFGCLIVAIEGEVVVVPGNMSAMLVVYRCICACLSLVDR